MCVRGMPLDLSVCLPSVATMTNLPFLLFLIILTLLIGLLKHRFDP